MKTVQIKVVNKGKQELPQYATTQSAGMDLRADIEKAYMLIPGERKLFPTGIHIQLPDGYEAQIRPRSGLSLKHGITCHFGTIDADYTGDVGVVLYNNSGEAYNVQPGERIAQMVIAPYVHGELVVVDALDETERGDGGYGHTGKK